MATTIYFVGVTLGGVIFGTLSDKFGRRRIVIITTLSIPVVGVILFFMKNYVAFVLLRLILGAFIQVGFLKYHFPLELFYKFSLWPTEFLRISKGHTPVKVVRQDMFATNLYQACQRSTNCSDAVILSSCYKLVIHKLLTSCWIAGRHQVVRTSL